MAHDVFISHSSRDKPVADAACARLEQAGHRCWLAPRDILPGKSWAEAIIEGIESARVFVLIFSGHANGSHQVLREIERAVSNGLIVIPFRIEDVTPSKSLEYFMSAPHWLDALTPPLERHFDRLNEVIDCLLGREQAAAPRTPLHRPPIGCEAKPGLTTTDAATVAAVTAVPLVAALTDLAPPWPDRIGYVSTAIILLGSAVAWEACRRQRMGRRRMWTSLGAGLTVAGLLGYLVLYSLFVEPAPGSSLRVVRGYACTAEAQMVYKEACPNLPRDALRDAEWESVMLWTRSSVTVVRIALLASWLVFTAGLTATVAAILARRTVR